MSYPIRSEYMQYNIRYQTKVLDYSISMVPPGPPRPCLRLLPWKSNAPSLSECVLHVAENHSDCLCRGSALLVIVHVDQNGV